jgi:hypothetical protein
VLDVRVGKFVILGRAKKNTQRQEKLVRAVKSCETEEAYNIDHESPVNTKKV